MSEAYANGDTVKGITVSRDASNNKIIGTIKINDLTDENGEGNPYFSDFVNLAEITEIQNIW